MKFAMFLGCNIPARLTQYETSARAVLDLLGVEAVHTADFNCCGYPLRNVDRKAFVTAGARNLALAEKEGLDLMTLCKCCQGSLKKVDSILMEESDLKEEVNAVLEKEDLKFRGGTKIKHLLSVLWEDVGADTLKEKIKAPFSGLDIAVQHGCHLLRPSKLMAFDDPVAPTIFDNLVGLTGASSAPWSMKLECCGAPVMGANDELSMGLTAKKIANAKEAGAGYLCTACTYCQIQFDSVQNMLPMGSGPGSRLPSLLYPQLLGIAMGVEEEKLGLSKNLLPLEGIKEYLTMK